MVHEHVHKESLPTEALAFEGTAYDLGWDGSRTDPSPESPVIPTLDHAIFLINAVRFRCGRLYHLFDDSDFKESLYSFYSEGQRTRPRGLWYIHFLIIIAFGKMFTQVKYLKGKPAGISLFVKALQILPDHTLLYSSPMVGQAMRMAMAHGMHTCMPVTDLGRDSVERCRKIWWTVYILDRHMTSIQGLPQSVDDHFIQTKLPSPVSSENITSLDMHIKLCRSIADINAMRNSGYQAFVVLLSQNPTRVCGNMCSIPPKISQCQESDQDVLRLCAAQYKNFALSSVSGPSR
ncbi:fungal specific transcription factor domain-containing protein [Aspergillus luchuensis]|uniref:Fungal specific transcription factor domain-containing protein n=1 Tax=Aspergillus kawachii TaxID=1069201 RepID=A0A146FFH6_ASPKA|nr:fungal specific transcription factor domain-containing protein [Aspergillus luchuensis]